MSLDHAEADLAAVHVSLAHVELDIAATRAQIAALEGALGEVTTDNEELGQALIAARLEIERLQALLDGTDEPEESEPLRHLFGTSKPLNAVGTLGIVRHYFQPGDFGASKQPVWGGEDNLVDGYAKNTRVFSVSIKDIEPEKIQNFLDTVPNDVTLALTFWHEHDGNIRDRDFTAAWWTEGCVMLSAIAHANGHLFGPIHNGWNPALWDLAECPRDLCDFWGADRYANSYEDPATLYSQIMNRAAYMGLPLLIGETGAPTANAAAQAAWCAKARTWVEANDVLAAMYWDSQKGTGTNWRFASDASKKAWFGVQ